MMNKEKEDKKTTHDNHDRFDERSEVEVIFPWEKDKKKKKAENDNTVKSFFAMNDVLDEWVSLVNQLSKGKKDLTKLIPVQKQVTRQGKTFTTTVYVSKEEAKEMQSHQPKVDNNEAKTKKETFSDFEVPKGKLDAVFVQKHLRPIRKILGTDKYKEYLKACGVEWEPNTENAAADTMRASSAAKKFLENGGKLDAELFEFMKKGGSAEDFKKKKDAPPADSPKVDDKPDEKPIEHGKAVNTNYYNPISEIKEIKYWFDIYDLKHKQTTDDLEVTKKFEELKKVGTSEDFFAWWDNGGKEASEHFKNMMPHLKKVLNTKAKLVPLSNYTYCFGPEEASEIGNKFFQKEKITKTEIDTIKNYTLTGYGKLNQYFRDKGLGKQVEDDPTLEKKGKVLDKLLRSCHATENVVVYRGLQPKGTQLEPLIQKVQQGKGNEIIGTEIIDHGFVSTTLLAGREFDKSVKLQISVPKGTKGMYVEKYSEVSTEKEFLLPKGTSFVVESYRYVGSDLYLQVKVHEQ